MQKVDEAKEFAPQIVGQTTPNTCARRKIRECEVKDLDNAPIADNTSTVTRPYMIDTLEANEVIASVATVERN